MGKITIAIDGFSSCGKSTMAKELSRCINYTFIDTGAMYRAVTLMALRNNIIAENGSIDLPKLEALLTKSDITQHMNANTGSVETLLNGENVENEIRTMRVSSNVSAIAAVPFVRTELVRKQQMMGKNGGVVMDGRDIGTSVFPDAELKIFVTASTEVRALRRFKELQTKGTEVPIDEVRKNLEERDYIDSHREVSPLRQAGDAVVIDNTNLSREEQLAMLLALYRERQKRFD